jgi:Beta protein
MPPCPAVVAALAGIPVLRIRKGHSLQLEAQADRIKGLDRGVIFRIEYGSPSNSLTFIDDVLARFEDISIFVDAGWSTDILSRTAWASAIIERVTQDDPGAELVVSGSSFPNAFSNNGDRRAIPISERFLYNNLVRQHNAAKLIYGDWGSTRPPSDPTPMRNVPRIDLPKSSEWISFRRDNDLDDDEDYEDIAKRVIADPDWPKDLSIWGTNSINWTATGEPGGITGPAAAAAARINIHLHRQAYFGSNDLVADGDEPFTDE